MFTFIVVFFIFEFDQIFNLNQSAIILIASDNHRFKYCLPSYGDMHDINKIIFITITMLTEGILSSILLYLLYSKTKKFKSGQHLNVNNDNNSNNNRHNCMINNKIMNRCVCCGVLTLILNWINIGVSAGCNRLYLFPFYLISNGIAISVSFNIKTPPWVKDLKKSICRYCRGKDGNNDDGVDDICDRNSFQIELNHMNNQKQREENLKRVMAAFYAAPNRRYRRQNMNRTPHRRGENIH